MDQNQVQSLLRSIAISSGQLITNITNKDRNTAYTQLEEFKKYQGRIPICINLLAPSSSSQEQQSHIVTINNNNIDVTVSTKLYALGIVKQFLLSDYSKLSENDRVTLRTSVISSARQLVLSSSTKESTTCSSQGENNNAGAIRVLGTKMASVIADLAERDFPQRWPTFMDDFFSTWDKGGIWGCSDDGGGVGYKMGLECLTIITEDCTDSDFNAKISSTRRNDLLTGLNEVAPTHILPPLFALLSQHYQTLTESRTKLSQMTLYAQSHTLTPPEKSELDYMNIIVANASQTSKDVLLTLFQFCKSMPLEWTVNISPSNPTPDFIAALLHLVRDESLKNYALKCLDALAQRKLDFEPWLRLVGELPGAIAAGNEGNDGSLEYVVRELEFHRGVTTLVSHMIGCHLAHIIGDTAGEVLKTGSQHNVLVVRLLSVMTEMLSHPSGRMHSEEINTWIALSREPQISINELLTQFTNSVFLAYSTIPLVKIRWEDVENGVHPMGDLVEASWDDEEEYTVWYNDVKSKSTQLFRLLAQITPSVAASGTESLLLNMLSAHGNGDPLDFLDDQKRLTALSTANMKLESVQTVLENVLMGLPTWSMTEDASGVSGDRVMIRNSVRTSLSNLTNALLQWTPNDSLLKHRRVVFLESLKHYWKHVPATLPLGFDALLSYLSTTTTFTDTESIHMRKRVGFALVSISKVIPHLLVPHLDELSTRVGNLLSLEGLLPGNQMNMYEVLSCVASAVEDPVRRTAVISTVLSPSLVTLESIIPSHAGSVDALMETLGISTATTDPSSVTSSTTVEAVVGRYVSLLSPLNRLLSVGKRCHMFTKQKGLLPLRHLPPPPLPGGNFPDEGAISLADLGQDDPFITPIWPRLAPLLLTLLSSLLQLHHTSVQIRLLSHTIQKYALAITDDEAYLARTTQNQKKGGVFGSNGTAGSILQGWTRRDCNLAAKWGSWLNELHMVCFQFLGLGCEQRVWYAPEMSSNFGALCGILGSGGNVSCSSLAVMEHRTLAPYLKQFIEPLLLTCPVPLYPTHLAPILTPLFSHIPQRLSYTWAPLVVPSSSIQNPKALVTGNCHTAITLLQAKLQGGGPDADDAWWKSYYARGGSFVGDLDDVTNESVVEKARVDLTRAFGDVIQTALALKGEWALVLANQAKEEQALRKNDPSKLTTGPRTRFMEKDNKEPVNADGTPRSKHSKDIEARQWLRIYAMNKFLLYEDKNIAFPLISGVIQCLNYPDQYTCRRITRICHRVIETTVSEPAYTPLLMQLFTSCVKSLVMEPKWMVGVEWDIIALVRDLYCRMVLGQVLLSGGQGPGVPLEEKSPGVFEQTKMVGDFLKGGGILCVKSDLPQRLLAELPGVGCETVLRLERIMKEKRAVKDQKDALRDMLRVAAEQVKLSEEAAKKFNNTNNSNDNNALLGRAFEEESLLNQNTRILDVPSLPEKLVTNSQMMKQAERNKNAATAADTLALGHVFS